MLFLRVLRILLWFLLNIILKILKINFLQIFLFIRNILKPFFIISLFEYWITITYNLCVYCLQHSNKYVSKNRTNKKYMYKIRVYLWSCLFIEPLRFYNIFGRNRVFNCITLPYNSLYNKCFFILQLFVPRFPTIFHSSPSPVMPYKKYGILLLFIFFFLTRIQFLTIRRNDTTLKNVFLLCYRSHYRNRK